MNEIRLADFRAEKLEFTINQHFNPPKDHIPLSVSLLPKVHMSGKPEDPIFLNATLTVFDDAEEKNYPFTILASVTGVFYINAEGSDRETIMKDQALSLLIPFVRAMIAQLVSLANIPTPVPLPPMDVADMAPAEQAEGETEKPEEKTESAPQE